MRPYVVISCATQCTPRSSSILATYQNDMEVDWSWTVSNSPEEAEGYAMRRLLEKKPRASGWTAHTTKAFECFKDQLEQLLVHARHNPEGECG